jgi:YbbR domain-containing protein
LFEDIVIFTFLIERTMEKEKEHWYKTKKFWVALFIAIGLWVYASLNDEYQTVVAIPLVVEPPAGRAIENILPHRVSVDFTGNGWYLFNYMYVNKMKRCKVNLDDVRKDDSIYVISSMDMQKGLDGINRIAPQRFYPERINVKTGEIVEKEVRIVSDANIKLRDGFVLVGDIKTEPQTVTLIGNKNLIDTIRVWKTKNMQFDRVNSSFSHTVQVSDSLSSVIDIKPQDITIFATVQQYAEMTFNDIEVRIINGQLPPEHTISPQFFNVTLSGGIELLGKIKSSDISITVDYETLINDKNGIIKPVITIPPFTKMLNAEPQFLQHNVYVKFRDRR